MKYKILLVLFTVMTLIGSLSAQQGGDEMEGKIRKVTGLVVDQHGEPIIGANIKLVDGNAGTITDADGRFSINVPEGKKLSISYIGCITQVITPKKNELKIFLQEDTNALDEVVVVGYGTQKLKNVTGSIASVQGKELEDIPVSNLSEALDGLFPGLSVEGGSGRPGESASLYIRQAKDFVTIPKQGGTSLPLVIIDDVIQLDDQGQPTLGSFNALNPADVESISVLRDASAAIYGSRAAQGAIIVKTKRGHSGAPRISYSGKYGVMDAISHAKQMSAYEYGVFANSFLLASERVKTGDPSYMNKLFSDSELEEMKGLDYNWLENAWKAAFTQSHTVNVSGGSDRATYYAGVTYYKQGANLGNQDYSKWSYRTGVDITLTSDLKFSATIAGNTSQKETSYTKVANVNDGSYGSKANGIVDYGYLAHMPRYIPWSMEVDGEEVYISPALGPHQTTSDINKSGKFGAWNYYALLNSGSASINDSNGWNANFSMTYQVPFVKGLSLRASYAISRSTSDNEQLGLPYTLYYNRNMVNADKHLYSAWQPADFVKTDITEKSRITYSDGISKRKQMNFFVNYQRQIGDHYFTGMFSIERGETYGHDKSLLYENPVKDQYNGMYNTAGTLSNSTTNGKNESGSLSYLGRATYNYANKYMLEFLFRSDASTKFAPENYWGFFPSVSAAWVISEEKWFKKIGWIDGLKFRASWGRTGRDNIAPWLWKQTYQMKNDGGFVFGTANGGTLGSSLAANKSPNRSIHWDKVDKFNFGIDARFFKSRLNLGIDLYYDKNDELLNQATVNEIGTPFFAGGSVADSNFGRIDTYGAEFSINWSDKIGQVKYNVGVNFSLNNNRVKTWPEPPVGYPCDNTISEGTRTKDYMPCWGYKVWRGTSKGDGLLRTQEDIDNYWAYLSDHAAAVGGEPKYFGKTKEEIRVGMLAYQDLHGPLQDGVLTEADGQITDKVDFAEISKNSRSKGFNTSIGLEWKGIRFKTSISTSWGGAPLYLDRIKLKASKDTEPLWAPEYYWVDMFDEKTNPEGKYPNLGLESKIGGSVIADSDFWKISNFRCYVRNISINYTLPSHWVKPLHITNCAVGVVAENLLDFYNPYPKHYRNMYNTSYAYPKLRNISMSLNVSF